MSISANLQQKRGTSILMKVTAGVLIEFGNSETRVIVLTGKKGYMFTMSNHFGVMTDLNFPRSYVNDKSTLFQVNGNYIAHGLYVEREFKGEVVRPMALKSKAVLPSTQYTLNLVFIKVLSILSQVHATPVSRIELTANVSVLMPPLDQDSNEELMISLIQSLKEISVAVPYEAVVPVNIQNVSVAAEGMSAVFGAMFEETGASLFEENKDKDIEKGDIIVLDNSSSVRMEEVKENKDFATGYMLVIDVGAGTTDVALVEDMDMIDRSKDTFRKGSNTVYGYVEKDIRRTLEITPDNRDDVMNKCIQWESGTPHYVEDIVTKAKVTTARGLLEDITKWLEVLTVSPRSIKSVLIAGGGSLPSFRDGVEVSPALSEMLVDFLKDLAPNIQTVHTSGKSVRLLNLYGLFYMHKYGGTA